MLSRWIDPSNKWLTDPLDDAFVLSAVDLKNAKSREKNILDDSLLWDAYGGRGEGLCFKIKLASLHAKKVIYSSSKEDDENALPAPDDFSVCLAKGLVPLRKLHETENLRDSLAWEELTNKIEKMLARHAYRYKIGSYQRENEIRFIHPGTEGNRNFRFEEAQPEIIFDEKGKVKSARNFRSHGDLEFRKLFSVPYYNYYRALSYRRRSDAREFENRGKASWVACIGKCIEDAKLTRSCTLGLQKHGKVTVTLSSCVLQIWRLHWCLQLRRVFPSPIQLSSAKSRVPA